jgi:hypothetical protein
MAYTLNDDDDDDDDDDEKLIKSSVKVWGNALNKPGLLP